MGKIVTFYSYNGGGGKSMAVANVATLLTRWGYRSLLVDWDLEAPGGIERFFEGNLTSEIPATAGILDLLYADAHWNYPRSSQIDSWEQYVVKLDFKLGDPLEGELDLLSAGRWGTADYNKKLHTFDVRRFYETHGASSIERLREHWKAKYDFVLIDCRSGVTPFGSICTIHLPDILVLLIQCDDRDLNGGVNIAKRVAAARRQLPYDRLELLTIPVPARFEPEQSPSGYEYERQWLTRFELAVSDFYKPWLPKDFPKQEMLRDTRIPYHSRSHVDDERLPSLRKHLPEPTEISKAYENIAALLANNLKEAKNLHEDRSGFLSNAWKNFSFPRVQRLHEEWIKTKHVYGQRANLTGRDCSNLSLVYAHLQEGIFVNTNFRSTSFLGANVVRADFSGANLEGANLKELKGAGANFRNAVLSDAKLNKADLRGANLQSAKLNKADLTDTKLYRATLRKAVLEEATGLTVKQFKAVDLSGAKLPKGLDEFRPLREVQMQSRRAKVLFFVLCALCFYTSLILFRISPVALVTNASVGPLVGGMPAILFVWIAPAIVLLLYTLFLMLIQRLWNNVIELPATFPDGLSLNEKISDWFMASLAYPSLGGRVGSVLKRRRLMLSLLTRFFIPLTQLFFWWKVLPLQSLTLKLYITLIVANTFALGWSYRRRGKKTLRMNNTGEHWQHEEVDRVDSKMAA